MERRAELEHPLGLVPPPTLLPPPAIETALLPAAPADFVLEIGTEELPPDDVVSACEQLRCAAPSGGSTLLRRATVAAEAQAFQDGTAASEQLTAAPSEQLETFCSSPAPWAVRHM